MARPQDRATRLAGHYTVCGDWSLSRAGLRLAEKLTRAGRPSQIDFKLVSRLAKCLGIRADDHRVRWRLAAAAQGPARGPWATARSLPAAFPRLQGWHELLLVKKGH